MRLSEHFAEREFRCKHCGVAKVSPKLVRHLEVLRELVQRPLVIVSGYRCTNHNAAVGGARNSRHLHGDAADLREGVATAAQAKAAGFTGIGTRGGWATHVDVRPGPPANWRYD